MDGVIDAFYRIEGGFLFFRGREDLSSGLTPPPQPIQCLVKGGERPDMWGDRR